MASRAGALLGSILDRVVPSGRRRPRRSATWTEPSPWSASWRTAPAPGATSGADDDTPPPTEHVEVTVVGEVPPDGATSVIDGTIEDEPGDSGDGTAGNGGSGAGGSGGSGGGGSDDEPADGGSDDEPDGGAAAGAAAAGATASGATPSGATPSGATPSGAPPSGATPSAQPVAGAALTPQRRVRDDAVWIGAIAMCGLLVLGFIGLREPVGGWLERQGPRQVARQFANAWPAGRLDRLTYDATSIPGQTGEQAATAVANGSARATAGLTTAAADLPQKVELVGPLTMSAKRKGTNRTATQGAQVTWRFDDGRTWTYPTTLRLRQQGSRWRLVWSPSTVHPQLRAGQGLVTERVQPARAPIVGSGGHVLVTNGTAYRVTFATTAWLLPRGDIKKVAGLAGVQYDWLRDRVRAAPKGTAVEVATLRPGAWRKAVGAGLLQIKGARGAPVRLPLAVTPTFAQSLLGTARPATVAMARASGGRLHAGDLTGATGLQLAFDERLSGTAGLRVVTQPLPSAGSLSPRSVRSGDRPLGTPVGRAVAAQVAGRPLHLSIDREIQRAAQWAVDHRTGTQPRRKTSLVAVDRRTGAVLAVASNVGEEWDRPLLGAYPAGSTFKVVTAWALTAQGATAAERLSCPASITVGGNPFRNADRAPGGVHPLARQFAMSCNTAFAGLGSRVSDAELKAAANELGIGVPLASLGIGAVAGSVPPTATPATHAAALIGQDRVSVSPLNMAVASATVAGGRYRAPQLVLDAARKEATTGAALDTARLATLRSLMCETVRSGTARALRAAPGGPVAGKTGTAQYDLPAPGGAHAWFTGYQGDVAFAVVVEGGGSGARAAVPVALRFLRGVNGDGTRARPTTSCGPATAALAADR